MQMKKQFVTPRVIQEVRIQLEKDLLGESIWPDTVATTEAQEVVEHNFNDYDSSYWE